MKEQIEALVEFQSMENESERLRQRLEEVPGRLDRLQRVLDALGQQTVPTDRWEVVVVSDGSTDGTNDWLAAQRPPFALRYVLQENGGVAVARGAADT